MVKFSVAVTSGGNPVKGYIERTDKCSIDVKGHYFDFKAYNYPLRGTKRYQYVQKDGKF